MTQQANLEVSHFGEYQNQEVQLFTLRNTKGMEVRITNFGAIITSIKVPSKQGIVECVLGFDTFEEYISPEYRQGYPYFGAVIGRNAGRVRNASFTLDGERIQLPQNHPPHHLHGGFCGFDSVVWQVVSAEEKEPKVIFSYVSSDGEQGYPGELTVVVSYELTENNTIRVTYDAICDKPTVVNLTQHTYFNFNKESGDITNHKIQISASECLPLNEELIPLGEKEHVTLHNLDFSVPRNVPPTIDDSFVRACSDEETVGVLECEETQIRMEVKTNYPILHIYGGYYVPELTPKHRKKTGKNAGVCFETQKYPDALNHSKFPTNRLDAGEKYAYETDFTFYF